MKKLFIGILSLAVFSAFLYAGVSRIVSNGNISSVPSWQVTCSSDKTVIIYKKNGTWYTGGLGHMGHKYDSWSRDEVAEYVCR
ncbi:hypothetical protein [Sulfurimonas sp.]